MKKKIQFIIGIVVLSAFIAGSAFAIGPDACPTERGKERFKEKKESIMRELNLTAEQDKLLKETKTAHRTEMEGLRKALKAKREALHKALATPGVTRQSLEPAIAEIKTLESQMIDHRIDGILKVKSILSPEQFQKLQGMKESRQNKPHTKRFGKDR